MAERVYSMPYVLWRYLAAQFFKTFIVTQTILLSVMTVFNLMELLRRSAKRPDVPNSALISMGLDKIPQAMEITLPFAILMGAMACLHGLSKRQELTVLRASGLSIWQMARPLALTAALIGVVFITALHPLGAIMTANFQSLETKYLGRTEKLVTITEQGLWLRETLPDGGDVILHGVHMNLKDWSMDEVMALFFTPDGTIAKRMDAKVAFLEKGQWRLNDITTTDFTPATGPRHHVAPHQDKFTLKTELTRDDIVRSFSNPDTISFWKLPRFIDTLAETGLETGPMTMYYQGLLALPLFLSAMILLATTLATRPPRFHSTTIMALSGIALGFSIFFLSNFFKALGSVHQLPPALAAWIPPLLVLMGSATYLLNKEDG